MKFGIIVFPGSNCDHDCLHVVTQVLGHEAFFLWHKDRDLNGAHCLILPGGFSFGDYLRSGAMAARSPIMDSVREFASKGGLVFGICNGFQILQEARLLPGALIRNDSLKFVCRDVYLRVGRTDTPFTCACTPGEVLRIPIAHMDGNFFADKKYVSKLKRSGQLLFRYCDEEGNITDEYNPNGSVEAIAGLIDERGNVCGMMPHPERCSESMLGNRDGFRIFESIVAWAAKKRNS
jgi:phosphoribosylformylglycinamidine synthase I